MKKINLGRQGEEEACRYLIQQGYHLIEKNYRNNIGEIDLIMKEGSSLCFIEVKTRTHLYYGAPWEAVHLSKQRKIVLVALSYVKFRFRTVSLPMRFDVVSVYKPLIGEIKIVHLKNAFDLSYLSH